MKITMFLTEQALQFNLEPESDHERKMMAVLEGYSGPATIHPGVNIDECRGQYLRNFRGNVGFCAVTIKKATPEGNPTKE